MIAGIVTGILGLFSLWAAHRTWRVGRRDVRAWPIVSGKIVERVVRKPSNPYRGHGTKIWEPAIRYAYSVNGHEYQGTRIYLPWPLVDTKRSAERLLSSIADTTDVHYNPTDPSQSVLFVAPLSWVVWLMVAALIGFGMSFLFLVTAVFGR